MISSSSYGNGLWWYVDVFSVIENNIFSFFIMTSNDTTRGLILNTRECDMKTIYTACIDISTWYFFISDYLSVVGSDISAIHPARLRADIESKGWWGPDMTKDMLQTVFHTHFRKMTNYNVILITERDMWWVFFIIYLELLKHFFAMWYII